jgi:hypothetical protein
MSMTSFIEKFPGFIGEHEKFEAMVQSQRGTVECASPCGEKLEWVVRRSRDYIPRCVLLFSRLSIAASLSKSDKSSALASKEAFIIGEDTIELSSRSNPDLSLSRSVGSCLIRKLNGGELNLWDANDRRVQSARADSRAIPQNRDVHIDPVHQPVFYRSPGCRFHRAASIL